MEEPAHCLGTGNRLKKLIEKKQSCVEGTSKESALTLVRLSARDLEELKK